jgi:hypothetical protein
VSGLALALAILWLVPAARATYPGTNGKIAFDRADGEIYTINPDGTGLTALIPGKLPKWSPDGTTLAYEGTGGIRVVDANGMNDRQVANTTGAKGPITWSPDGTEVAFFSGPQIQASKVDGSGFARTLFSFGGNDLDWGPDGRMSVADQSGAFVALPGQGRRQVAAGNFGYVAWGPGAQQILTSDGARAGYRIAADGGGMTLLAGNLQSPTWSPDGALIVGHCCDDTLSVGMQIMDDAGSGRHDLAPGAHPDWQPIRPPPAQPGYPRPKGASPFYAPLVLSYEACTAPNRFHAPPLAFGSCTQPKLSSEHLTAGTPDANAQTANFVGSLKLKAIAGNPSTPADEADVQVEVHATDVRCSIAEPACAGGLLSDYTGSLAAFLSGQITDRASGGAADAATGTMPTFQPPGRFSVPCTATADPAIGSDCDVVTTVDTLLPNSIQESRRTVWQLSEVRISDGGPNGDPADFEGTPFLTQGVFTP